MDISNKKHKFLKFVLRLKYLFVIFFLNLLNFGCLKIINFDLIFFFFILSIKNRSLSIIEMPFFFWFKIILTLASTYFENVLCLSKWSGETLIIIE